MSMPEGWNVIEADPQKILAAVRAHALQHYEDGGWDVIVECYSDPELLELIGDATTAREAIKRVGRTARLLAERDREIRATEF